MGYPTGFKCPYCKTDVHFVEHDYTVKALEKIIKGNNGKLTYGKKVFGNTVTEVFRCPKCNYEAKTLSEFEE